jgi:excisionase family DNA binding protein
MNKVEAARELKISVRSLIRAANDGKIGVAYQRGKSGKKEAVYDAGEIARYKEELNEVIRPPEGGNKTTALAMTTRDAQVAHVVALLLEAIKAQATPPPPVLIVPIENKLILSLIEVSALTGLSKNYLTDAIHRGKLKATKRGRWFIKRSDLDAYIKKL